jgi:hypothetical protein
MEDETYEGPPRALLGALLILAHFRLSFFSTFNAMT